MRKITLALCYIGTASPIFADGFSPNALVDPMLFRLSVAANRCARLW
jgi:hypothetical protein